LGLKEGWIRDTMHRGMNDNSNQLGNSLQEPLSSDPLLISQFDSWAKHEFAKTEYNLRKGGVQRMESNNNKSFKQISIVSFSESNGGES